MASIQVVRRSLTAFANNYNKGEKWIEDTLRLWARGLQSITDKDLIRGTESWCRTKRTLPNLARLLELIDADPSKAPRPFLAGCPACDFTGWREMVRHYTKDDKKKVRSCVAACDCAKGSRYATETVQCWRDVLRTWESDPWTDAVHYGTAEAPHLKTEHRHTAEQIEQMEARAKVQLEKVSGWSSVLAGKSDG